MDNGLKDVRHWLDTYTLGEFLPTFTNRGYTSLPKCCHLTDAVLADLNVPQPQRSLLLHGVNSLRNKYTDYRLHSPSGETADNDDDGEDDAPPPLPEKKIRRSLPAPKKPAPPAAPPRKSVLKSNQSQLGLAVDLATLDFPPPPPPDPAPAMTLPTPPRKSSQELSPKAFIESLPQNYQDFLSPGHTTSEESFTVPPEQPPKKPAPATNSQNKPRPPVKPRPSLNPEGVKPVVKTRPANFPSSPQPLRAALSSTLPKSRPVSMIETSKSSTLPTTIVPTSKDTSNVSSIVHKFHSERMDSIPRKSAPIDESLLARKNTVKNIAKTLHIPVQPISGILPERAGQIRYIIPNRKKIEPKVPSAGRRQRRMTMGEESSEDTLDTSGDEEAKEEVPAESPPSIRSPELPEHPSVSFTRSTSDEARKVRVMTDTECKKIDKKWDNKSGWLWKQGGLKNNRGWKKRWFVFANGKFAYYTSNKPGAESLSCTSLSNLKEVKMILNHKEKSHKFLFELSTKTRQYLLSAETSEERTLWCNILQYNIQQCEVSIWDDLVGGEMNKPDQSGNLKKQGNSRIRDWKTRFCAVKDGYFCYYENYEAFRFATPINSIYCGTLKARISDRAKFKFEVIVPNRTYYFIAESDREMMQWIDALNKAVADALTDLKSSASSAKELIQRIYEEPSNAFCADCLDPEPKWASINLGIVVCINCSGSHRDLGVHVSKVRSLELDVKAWTDDMVSVFHMIGNKRANEYFEKHLDEQTHPRPAPNADMKSFIDAKYKERRWCDTVEGTPAALNSQLMEVVQGPELHRTLALLMSGADVKWVDPHQENAKNTPYLMAMACGQKAQAQLLLLNDAEPVLPEAASEDLPGMNDLVDLEGVLEKKGPNTLHSFKKRRCVLSGKNLRYYDEDANSLKNVIDLYTMIDVALHTSENPEDTNPKDDGYTYLLIRTRAQSSSRTYTFRDKNREYLSDWCEAIRSTQVFGVSIDKQAKTSSGVPVLIHKCVMYLADKTDQEGIYRISGVKSRYEALKLKCNQNIHDVVFEDEPIGMHDVTSLLKLFFRELPVSLLAPWYLQLTNAMEIEDETEKLYQIQDIIYELPGTEFHTLKFLIGHLYKVAQCQEINKMTSENLGVVFGPTLMSTRDPSNEFSRNEYQLVRTFIDYFPWLFQVNVDEEAMRGEELRQAEEELRKIMCNIDAPKGSSQNSWIVEVSYLRESVNIRIDAGQTLRDVSAEILNRTKLVDGDYALHEFLCDGDLKRPVHLSEYLLNTTVTLWDERVQRSWLAIDSNTMKEKMKKAAGKFADDTQEHGSLHVYEGKKRWREVSVKLAQETLSYSRLRGRCTINLQQYTWYLGCEAGLGAPTEHTFTLRTTDHAKEEQFRVFCASEEQDLWRWLWRINAVKHMELDYRLVKSKRAVLSTSSHRSSMILTNER